MGKGPPVVKGRAPAAKAGQPAAGKGAQRPGPPRAPPQKQQATTSAPNKRPLPDGAPAPGAKKQSTSTGLHTYVVYSTNELDELGIDTLVGEYVETGTNHGKKTFKRKPQPDDPKNADVFMYYWDNRDGPDFSGWWFGSAVGGEEVYSRCAKADPTPPKSGWRIPWDGALNKDLVVELKTTKARAVAPKDETKKEAKEEALEVTVSGDTDERVQRATDRVAIAEIEATQALESGAAMLEGDVDEKSLKSVEELLQAQQSALTDANKVLAADIMDANKTAPQVAQLLRNLTPRVRTVQVSLAQELKRVKGLRAEKKAEIEEVKKREKEKEQLVEAEQRDAKTLEEALPVALDAITKAETLLENVAQAAAPIIQAALSEAGSPDQASIKDTEAAAAKAEEAVKEARTIVSKQVMLAKKFAPEAKRLALTEFCAVQDKLKDVNKKLAPYKNIRQDLESQLKARNTVSQATKQLDDVEVKVSNIMSATVGVEVSAEEAKSAESTLTTVDSSLADAMSFVNDRVTSAQGELKDHLSQIQTEGIEAKKKSEELRTKLRAQMEQLQVGLLLKQALDKAEAAEESLLKTADAEVPFEGDVSSLTVADKMQAIGSCKKAAELASGKVIQAKSFLKSSMGEVKRFPKDSQESALAELNQLQDRVEAVSQKLTTFKRETDQREVGIVLQELTTKVDDVEAKVKKLTDITSALEGNHAEELSIAQLKETTEKAMEVEKDAAKAGGAARKALMARRTDPLVKESPACALGLEELGKRLTAAQQEHTKWRKLAIQSDKTCKARLLLQEKEEQMKKVETEVDRVDMLTTPLDDEMPSEENAIEMVEALEGAEQAVADVRGVLEVAATQECPPAVRTRLDMLLARTRACQDKVDDMYESTAEQRKRVKGTRLVQAGRLKLEQVEAAYRKISEAELPFLKGVDISVEESTKAIADSEAASVVVNKAINEARLFLDKATSELRELGDDASNIVVQEIEALQAKNKEYARQLSQFKKETGDRKRSAVQDEVTAKIDEAELAVQKLEQVCTSLPADDGSELTEETSEKLQDAQQEAVERFGEARRFSAQRQREQRGLLDASIMTKFDQRLESAEAKLGELKSVVASYEQKRRSSD